MLVVVFFYGLLCQFLLSTFLSLVHRSRQTSLDVTDSMNTEEIYKNLRKTTAEIQNYSFETKLDRDANSKDSGISQMGELQMQNPDAYQFSSNGFNGHLGLVLLLLLFVYAALCYHTFIADWKKMIRATVQKLSPRQQLNPTHPRTRSDWMVSI